MNNNKKPAKVKNNTGNFEWYTPTYITDAVKTFYKGEIDLDPLSCEFANQFVGAREFYSIEDDGFKQPWEGNIWINPPYQTEYMTKTLDKIEDVCRINPIKNIQICMICNNSTETKWFQRALVFAKAVCFLNKRVKFIDQNGVVQKSPLQGQVLFYFSSNLRNHIDFSKTLNNELGRVLINT